MKQPHFLHVDTNSQKLKVVQKFLVRCVQNTEVADLIFSWLYLQNEQMKLTDFCMLVQIYAN